MYTFKMPVKENSLSWFSGSSVLARYHCNHQRVTLLWERSENGTYQLYFRMHSLYLVGNSPVKNQWLMKQNSQKPELHSSVFIEEKLCNQELVPALTGLRCKSRLEEHVEEKNNTRSMSVSQLCGIQTHKKLCLLLHSLSKVICQKQVYRSRDKTGYLERK